MCKVQMLRSLVKQRLTAAAEEIFGLFERTIAEYEEELSRSKEENERQRKLLDAVLNPQLRLHRADVQQLLSKEDVPPEQHEGSFSLDQADPEPPHIKEEQEELWTSQEGEQLQGLEEADITKFPFSPVPVKSEDDEEELQSSVLHQRQTEDYGGPQPDRNSDPDRHPEPDTIEKTVDSSVAEIEVSCDDWEETREPQSGLNFMNNYEVPGVDLRYSAGERPFRCFECGKSFGNKHHLKIHMVTHTGEKRFSCPVCNKAFTQSGSLRNHVRIHTGEKPFSCSICGKAFIESGHLKRHMRTHTREKPFSCSICNKYFTQSRSLQTHMVVHTGEKRYSCSVCNNRFAWHEQLRRHKCVGHQFSQLHQTQIEEKREAEPPASSSTEHMKTEAYGEDCGGPEPARNSDPDRHPEPDTDDKTGDFSEPEADDSDDDWKETREPQSGFNALKKNKFPVSGMKCICSQCGRIFTNKTNLKVHMIIHTQEKPFRCNLCGKSFSEKQTVERHMTCHMRNALQLSSF